jgi:hypothetical protein
MRADLAAQSLIDVDRRPRDRERDREHAEGVAPVFGGLHSRLLYIFGQVQSSSAQGGLSSTQRGRKECAHERASNWQT